MTKNIIILFFLFSFHNIFSQEAASTDTQKIILEDTKVYTKKEDSLSSYVIKKHSEVKWYDFRLGAGVSTYFSNQVSDKNGRRKDLEEKYKDFVNTPEYHIDAAFGFIPIHSFIFGFHTEYFPKSMYDNERVNLDFYVNYFFDSDDDFSGAIYAKKNYTTFFFSKSKLEEWYNLVSEFEIGYAQRFFYNYSVIVSYKANLLTNTSKDFLSADARYEYVQQGMNVSLVYSL